MAAAWVCKETIGAEFVRLGGQLALLVRALAALRQPHLRRPTAT